MSSVISTTSTVAAPSYFDNPIIYKFQSVVHVDRNFIQIPSACHIQWGPTYPPYVTFDYNGEKHFIKIRRDGNKFYFADGLKDFRRALGIYEGLVVHFATPDRNTSVGY
ncbi:hypothetical protein GLYMA_03G099250v4 [Glycine max]|uniref:uncharacterized protein LOC114405465 n=1 Tax=Glycine soja TaxID=3848 RepID=UPI000861E607|nr:uncharacterized protein LOC114405465 [Glycine soja]KAG4393489.1 hypothetical protein GLYMA_03G099250v4 [Glycine max]